MPAKSKAQQKAAGAALAAKRGEQPKEKLRGASRQMVRSMNEAELEELASTKRKGKPQHVDKRKSASSKVSASSRSTAAKSRGRKVLAKSRGSGAAAKRTKSKR